MATTIIISKHPEILGPMWPADAIFAELQPLRENVLGTNLQKLSVVQIFNTFLFTNNKIS